LSIAPAAQRRGVFRDPHATIDFHAARIAALHFRQQLRAFLLLNQHATDAALAEVDRERQARRPAADDEDVGIKRLVIEARQVLLALSGCRGMNKVAA